MDGTLLEKYPDRGMIKDFWELSDERLTEIGTRVLPSARDGDLVFIRSCLKKELGRKKPIITLGLLRLLSSIICKRRGMAEAYRISMVDCQSPDICATYTDLTKKARALYGKRWSGGTLLELSMIQKDYLAMIGREDDGTAVCYGSSDNGVTLIADGKPLLAFEGKSLEKEPFRAEAGLSLVLIIKRDNCIHTVKSLAEASASLCRAYVRLSEYGLIGTAVNITDGATIDGSALPFSLSEYADILDGAYFAVLAKDKLEEFFRIADEYGFEAYKFATVGKKGIYTLGQPSLSLSRELLEKFLFYTEDIHVAIQEGAAAVSEALDFKGEGNGENLYAARRATPTDGSFLSALYTSLDTCTQLICRGVNRRGLQGAICYTLEGDNVLPEALGEDMAMLLGTYRFSMELALPCAFSDIKFAASRGLVYSAYGYSPYPVAADTYRGEAKICVLPIEISENGLPDFKKYRELCDRYYGLTSKGKVLSARAFIGSASDALTEFAQSKELTLNEDALKALEGMSRGIIFETADTKGLYVLGEAAPISQGTVEN